MANKSTGKKSMYKKVPNNFSGDIFGVACVMIIQIYAMGNNGDMIRVNAWGISGKKAIQLIT
jgi:hypothetical protein